MPPGAWLTLAREEIIKRGQRLKPSMELTRTAVPYFMAAADL